MGELLSVVWARRKRLFWIWAAVMVVALIRVVTMPDLYTSTALLTPLPLEQVEQQAQGGVASASMRSLLGRTGSRDEFAVAAFLQSRQLLDRVVSGLDLKKTLFPGRWDEEAETWRTARGGEPGDGESSRVLDRRVDVSYDEFTGLMHLEVHWNDPATAHRVANAFLEIADNTLREAAIAEGERRIAELSRELDTARVGEIGAYLAGEMTRAVSSLASIRARASYAFRVIDPPNLPDRASWPPRLLLIVLVGLATVAVELGVVLGIHLRRVSADRTLSRPS